MAPIKSAIARSLRSKPTIRNPPFVQNVSRGITVTGRKPTFPNAPRAEPSTPFIPSDLQPQLPLLNISHPPNHTTPFDNLLNEITQSLATTRHPSLPHLHTVLKSYPSNPTHWSKYAHANLSKQYTRNLVCEVPGVFNLLLLVWTPGKKSLVHDHAEAHCLMKVLKGSILETRFATPQRPDCEGPLLQTSNQSFGLNKVSYMADQLGLHSISNPHPTEFAVSLHLYTPPNAAMRGCHVFDEVNGEKRHVMQGVYDSVDGKVEQN